LCVADDVSNRVTKVLVTLGARAVRVWTEEADCPEEFSAENVNVHRACIELGKTVAW